MILVDTSVWVDHLRDSNAVLLNLIAEGVMLHHPFVTAELALGKLPDRDRFCAMLHGLPQAVPVSSEDLATFVVERELLGAGLGMVDAHLLASTILDGQNVLWSTDRRLANQAQRLGVAYHF